MVSKYTTNLPIPLGLPHPIPGDFQTHPKIVLLTGSTGSLGSYLLELLLQSPSVERVWALNRPSEKSSLSERQINAFKERGIDEDLLRSAKLRLVEGTVSREMFGLGERDWYDVSLSIPPLL